MRGSRTATSGGALLVMGVGAAVGAVLLWSLSRAVEREPTASAAAAFVPSVARPPEPVELPAAEPRPHEELPVESIDWEALEAERRAREYAATIPASARLTSSAAAPAHVSGIVLRGTTPVPDVRVGFAWQHEEAVGGLMDWYASAITDLQGRFDAELDPERSYAVEVILDHEQSESRPPLWLAPGSRHELTLKLVPLCSVTGVVLTPEGKRTSLARVFLWQGEPREAPVDVERDGETSVNRKSLLLLKGKFTSDVPSRVPCTFIAQADSAAPSEPVVVLLSEDEPEALVTLRLNPAAYITGRVRTPDGAPVAGVHVEALPIEALPLRLPGAPPPADRLGEGIATTDAFGNFSLGPLHPAGVFEVRCAADDAGLKAGAPQEAAAGRSQMDFVLEP